MYTARLLKTISKIIGQGDGTKVLLQDERAGLYDPARSG